MRDMGRAMFSPALQQMLDSKQGHSEVNENNEIKSYIFRAEQILYWGTRQAGRAAKRPGQGAKEGGAPRNIKIKGKIVSERRNEQRITRRALRYTVKTGLFSISVPQTVPLQIPDMLI